MKDAVLRASLRKSPKLKTTVLHPRNTLQPTCKQNVPTAISIFHETTAAAANQFYFPDECSTVEFLKFFSKLYSKWWVISSSKISISTSNCSGSGAFKVDQKLSFLWAMTEWIQAWRTERIPNCNKVTLTA